MVRSFHFLRTFELHFFEVRPPRIEFLEIGTGRYSSAPTFFQNLTRTKYAVLNFGCGGRSGLPSCRRQRLVSEAAAGVAAATTAGKAGAAGDFVGSAGAAAAATAAGVVQTYRYIRV